MMPPVRRPEISRFVAVAGETDVEDRSEREREVVDGARVEHGLQREGELVVVASEAAIGEAAAGPEAEDVADLECISDAQQEQIMAPVVTRTRAVHGPERERAADAQLVDDEVVEAEPRRRVGVEWK